MVHPPPPRPLWGTPSSRELLEWPYTVGGAGVPLPPRAWAIARAHKRRSAQKAHEENGSSVAYKTTGTFSVTRNAT